MSKIKTITQAVPALLTWLAVETCLERNGITPTKELVNGIVARANYHFNTNEVFKKMILSKKNNGTAGRDGLYGFLDHWIKGKYWERHELLPEQYKPYQEEVPDYKN